MRSAVAAEPGYIVRHVQLSTLGFTIPDLRVDVADLGHGIDGVLGMNFLSDSVRTTPPFVSMQTG